MRARARVSDKRVEMRDRKRKIRNKMECDTESRDLLENHTAVPLFTFRRRRWRSRALPANAGWQISDLTPLPGLSISRPSCHLSNDFFILQEELVARGNAPLPARGNLRLGRAETWAGLGPSTSAATSQGTNTSFHPACFFAFFFPSIHTVISRTLFSSSSHLSSGGSALLLSSNSLPLTYE